LIPTAVREAVKRDLPAYDLPRESDNPAEDIAGDRSRGGTGCLGVAVGRFLGKPTNDYALLLTARRFERTRVIIATQSAGTWSVKELHDFGNIERSRLFVSMLPPGHYQDVECCTPEKSDLAADGHLQQFTSARPGIALGALGATASGMFFLKGQWRVLGLSD
jgi:hypothetical protein